VPVFALTLLAENWSAVSLSAAAEARGAADAGAAAPATASVAATAVASPRPHRGKADIVTGQI
jgi:hypothetical protein